MAEDLQTDMSQSRVTLSKPSDEIYIEEATSGSLEQSNKQPETNFFFSNASASQPGTDIEVDLVLVPVDEISVKNIKSRRKVEFKKYAKANTTSRSCGRKTKTDLFVDSDDFEFIRMEIVAEPGENIIKEIINENSTIDFKDTSDLGVTDGEVVAEKNPINNSRYDSKTSHNFSDPESNEHDIKIELIASNGKGNHKINTKRPITLASSTHTEIKHSNKLSTNRPSYPCKDCSNIFHSSAALTKHSRLHAVTITQKLYLCEECGNIFLGLTALKIHARTHLVDKRSTHFDRGEKYTLNDPLLLRSPSNDFVRNMGDKLFACLECNESYDDVSLLIKHNLIHASDKPFCCETCGKLFRLRHSLTSHMLCHTGNKTYVCNECNKAFSKSDTWVRHKETCGIIFGCKECGLTFTARHHLNLHSRVHSGIKRIIIN